LHGHGLDLFDLDALFEASDAALSDLFRVKEDVALGVLAIGCHQELL